MKRQLSTLAVAVAVTLSLAAAVPAAGAPRAAQQPLPAGEEEASFSIHPPYDSSDTSLWGCWPPDCAGSVAADAATGWVGLLRESLGMFSEAGNDTGTAMVMDVMAEVASATGDHGRAVRLSGATSVIKDRVGGGAPRDLMRYGDPRAAAIEVLGETAVERIWAEGAAMDQVAAVAYARAC